MSNLHLVTGYAGKAHVSAADHGSFVEAVIRSGQFVTNAGSKFAAAVISNNQIRISDGELIMQGRHVKLDSGAYIDVTVENGAQGYYRNDLIVARYLKNADSGIETIEFVTIKGTPVESDPSDPAYVTGDINGGNALQNDMPMYRVPLDGLNVGELVPLFTPQSALYDLFLRRDGSVPMGGKLDMRSHPIKNVAAPTEDGDAVNRKYANEKFAPAGYGLGNAISLGTVTTEDGLTEILNTAHSGMKDGEVKQIRFYAKHLANYEWYGTISRLNQNYCTVVATTSGVNSTIYKSRNDSGWGPVEWENPPLYIGVEYRTTERWNGKVVYAMDVSCGALPNNTTKVIENIIPASLLDLVDERYSLTDGRYQRRTKHPNLDCRIDGTDGWKWISLTTTSDLSGWTATAFLKYTKS